MVEILIHEDEIIRLLSEDYTILHPVAMHLLGDDYEILQEH